MKRTVIIVFLFVSALLVFAAALASPAVRFVVTPDPLPLGTAATLTLTNDTDEFLTLASRAPWSIHDDVIAVRARSIQVRPWRRRARA